MSEIDFKLRVIESQLMNWKTGIMTVKRYEKGEQVTKEYLAMSPKSPMYYALKRRRKR